MLLYRVLFGRVMTLQSVRDLASNNGCTDIVPVLDGSVTSEMRLHRREMEGCLADLQVPLMQRANKPAKGFRLLHRSSCRPELICCVLQDLLGSSSRFEFDSACCCKVLTRCSPSQRVWLKSGNCGQLVAGRSSLV